ncbi:TetR/AcrR family transcriptional regulator [Variovorax sp. GB1P17]|uniref:TetR/AcrR family transcriptional regulator n=1 Tax=Variovorax sp. GB1P17 TaxID=3443740 RepID=UPI003F477733
MKTRTEMRRNAILEAALALFREQGYERASMNELAKRLGGSKATLYGYFPSKEELFVAVVQSVATSHLAQTPTQLLEASGDVSLESMLESFGKRMLSVLSNDADALAVYRMVIAEAGHSNVGQLFYESGPTEFIQTLAGLMASAMEYGELRRADPVVTAMQFSALVTAETQVRLYQSTPPPLSQDQIEAMVQRAVQMFLAGAAAR